MKSAWGILTIIFLSLFFLAGVNSAFAAIDDLYVTARDDSYDIDNGTILDVPAPGVLSNDTGGADLQVSSVDIPPNNGSLYWKRDGHFIYTPDVGFYGSDSFRYTATATGGKRDYATVYITVNLVNLVAIDDSYQTGEGVTLSVPTRGEGVLGNDVALEGDKPDAELLSDPSGGSLTLNSNGSFEYTPNAGFLGEDSFGYRATTYHADGTRIKDMDEAMVYITVIPINHPPVANANGPYTELEGKIIYLDASGSSDPDGDALQYRWDFDSDGTWDTSWSTLSTASHTWGDDHSGTVTVEVSDGDLTDTDTSSVTVTNVAPSVDAGPDASVSEGSAFSSSGEFSDPSKVDTWTATVDYGDGSGIQPLTLNLGKTFALDHVYADNGVYTVTVIVTDDDGGVGTDNVIVTMNTAAFTWVPEPQDEGSPVQFTDQSASDPIGWSWNFGGLGTSADQNPSFTFMDDGVYTVTLTVTHDDGSTGTISHDVTVNNIAPTVDAGPDQAVNPGDVVSFAGSFTDPGISDTHATIGIIWYFGDSAKASGTLTPTHVYADDGVYTVTLTVRDDDGGVGTDTLTVTVAVLDLAPTAAFTWSPEPQDEGASVQFTDQSTSSPDAIVSWSWDFGGLGASTEQNPSFTFMDDGTYTVTLTVTDDDGSTDTVSHAVTVLDLRPTAAFTWTPEPQYEGSPVDFTDTSTSSPDMITGWSWDFDGLGTSTEQNPSFTFMDDGTYTVTLTVTDDDGSTDSVSQDVIVLDLAPTAAFDWSPEPQNEGSSVQFTDQSTSSPDAIVSRSWVFGGLGTSTDPDPSFTFVDDGTYTVTLTVTDDDGSTDTISHDVTVKNVAPTVDAGLDATINEGSTFSSSGSFTDPGADTWTATVDYGDGSGVQPLTLTGMTFDLNHVYADNGAYTVTVAITDDDSGVGTDTLTVTVLDLAPTAAFTWSPEPQKEGFPVQIIDLSTSSPDAIVSWSWDFNADAVEDASVPSPSHTFMDNGTYTVTLIVTDDDGSTDSVTHHVTVVDMSPAAAFTWSPEPQDEGSPVQFTDQSTSYPDTIVAWSWDFGGLDTNTEPDPTFTFMDDGAYTVTLIVTDDDGSTDTVLHDVIVNNVAPEITSISAPLDPVQVGTVVNTSAIFTDPGIFDTHMAEWKWGDSSTSPGTVTEPNGSGCVVGSYVYSTPGVYTLELTVTEKEDGGSDSESYQYVVVYDPESGFVTGGGWIDSPSGAYTPEPDLTGKANFGFVSKYKQGATTPAGQTEFQFKVASLNFHSTAYQWLVVAGHQAKYKGDGTVDGAGDYGFMLSAVDGDIKGDGIDRFRIKIWDKATDAVVYDNEMGDADDAEPTTVIGGGSIKIHTANAAPPHSRFAGRGAALPSVPMRFRLLANYPNPFNPETWLPYELAEDRSVTIRIYNASGRLVRLLDLGHKPAGFYTSREKSAYWDGRNESGESVSSGIYFYQIQAGDFTAMRKMVIAK